MKQGLLGRQRGWRSDNNHLPRTLEAEVHRRASRVRVPIIDEFHLEESVGIRTLSLVLKVTGWDCAGRRNFGAGWDTRGCRAPYRTVDQSVLSGTTAGAQNHFHLASFQFQRVDTVVHYGERADTD